MTWRKSLVVALVATLLLFGSVPTWALRARVVVTDDFNRSDGTLITGNWSASTGGASSWTISGNTATPNDIAGDDLVYWNSGGFSNDQYSQVVLGDNTAPNKYIGPACRVTASGNGYSFYADTNQIYEWTSGTRSDVGSPITATWVNGDVMKMTCVGTTITIYQNGVSRGSESDASIASGAPGMFGYPTVNSWADDFEGGDAGGGATINPAPINTPIRGGGVRLFHVR